MIKRKILLRAYVSLIILIGIFLVAFSLPQINFNKNFFFYLILSIFAESLPIKLPWNNITISIGFPVNFASILALGTPGAILVGYLTLFIVNFKKIKPELPIYKMLFNSSQLSISIFLAGMVFYNLGGSLYNLTLLQNTIPIIFSIIVYFITNSTLLSIAVSLDVSLNFLEIWTPLVKNFSLNYLSLASIGVLIAFVQIKFGWIPVLLFLLPLLLARYSFKLYVEIKDLYKNTILALAEAVDAKDPYTRGHSERVSKYAEKIGKKLNLSSIEMDKLVFSAILHDIGKIGIPDSILKKKAKLTKEEYEIIKGHPAEGEKIIKTIPFLKEASKIIRYHHEKIDGTGYPDRLKGDKIPLFSKIIAICDSYDAMTSDRPYRKALSKEEAIEELKKYQGIQFDEKLTEIFIEILKEEETV